MLAKREPLLGLTAMGDATKASRTARLHDRPILFTLGN